MNRMYFLDVTCSGLGISVELNDIALVNELTGESIRETQPVNNWLRSEANTLTVKLTPALPEPNEPLVFGEQSASVVLFISELGAQTIQVGKVLSSFSWPLTATDTEVTFVLPYEFSERTDELVPMPCNMVLWNKTSPIAALSSQDKKNIYDCVKHLSSLIMSKHTIEAFQFMGLKYQDQALADNKPISRLQAAAIEMWEHMASMPGLELQEIAPDELRYDLVGHSHLVNVTRLDGAPAVLFEDHEDEMYFGLPLMFGLVEGKWRVVR